jgi:transcriptional regulator with XRE-family HTH domain
MIKCRYQPATDTIVPMNEKRPLTASAGLIIIARREAGLTQQQLADAVGVNQTVISAYERAIREPTMTMLLKILKGAGRSLRLELTPYDDHDDVLAAIAAKHPERVAAHDEFWRRHWARLRADQGV